jgi:hypothetical protein
VAKSRSLFVATPPSRLTFLSHFIKKDEPFSSVIGNQPIQKLKDPL